MEVEKGTPGSKAPGGRIIYLNGVSSSGKTTLARELQKILPEPYLYLGIDLFIYMLPERYWNEDPAGFTLEKSDRGTEVKSGPVARKLGQSMQDTIGMLARSGHNLIVDDVILDRANLEACLETLANFQYLFVKVDCPLEVAEQRERERGDRESGLARFQYAMVQAIQGYDIEVDSAAFSARACAQQIKDKMDYAWPRSDREPGLL